MKNEKPLILIVDDHPANVKLLVQRLKLTYRIYTAENGLEAFDAIEKDLPDLILLDIRMPGMDGYEVCERLKATPRTKDIPVIFLTAVTETEEKTRGFKLGAVDYITKPFHWGEVKARVQTHLSIKEMREELIRFNLGLKKKVDEKTEQLRQKDLQLIEMDRIAGIGDLAAGIAHEINTPLGFVKSSVGSLQKSADKMIGAIKYWDDKPVPEPLLKDYKDYLARMDFDRMPGSLEKKLVRIQRGIERIMKIINSLRRFSRVDMDTLGKIDVNQSMEEAVEIMSTQDDKDVEFIKDTREVPRIECSPTEINLCLFHILKNSLDAIDQKGTIKMTTSYDEKADEVAIRIEDNGKGMSPEVLRQALNPFFTTKAVGSGTGVGLSLTERIIKRHGGRIDISSKEAEGTTVMMTLPVSGEILREQR